MKILLALLLAAAPAFARTGDAEAPLWARPESPSEVVRVGEVAFEGADAGAVRGLVGIVPGAPLDARDVREAVRALHGSARFSRVAAYVEPLPREKYKPGWTKAVRLVFTLVPVQKLVSVAFPGRSSVPEGVLLQAANLQLNSEFQPDEVPRAIEAIRAAYHRVGFRAAVVTPVRRAVQDGVALELRIAEGQATRIGEVRFSGDPALDREQLLTAFKLQRGDVLNLAAVDEGVRGLRDRYRRAGRLRAHVDAPIIEDMTPRLARITVPVQAGPVVRFRVRGNAAYPDSLLVAQLRAGLDEEPIDEQAAQEMTGRLRRFYVSQGFLRARVAEREITARDGAVELVFAIDEGRPVRVEQIRFEGNKGVATKVLRERVLLLLRDNIVVDPEPGADPWVVDAVGIAGQPRVPRRARYRVDPDTVFDPVLYARALKQIEDLYKSEGYLSARAGPPKPEPIGSDVHRVIVTIPIQEGEQSIVSRIAVEGGGDVPPGELQAAVALKIGKPFSYLGAEEGRSAITQIFTRRGHLYARVEDDEQFEENDEPGKEFSRVDVRYRIQPGPVVKVGYVEIVGNRRTQEQLIRDLIGVRQGDVLTSEVLERSQQELLRTGLFFSATLTPRNPEVPESEKTLQVQLRERPTKDFQATIGFSLADGPRTTAQWTQANLWGRNLTFSAVAKVDFPFLRYTNRQCPPGSTDPSQCSDVFSPPNDPLERVVDLGLTAPRLYPLSDALRASVDLIHERALQPSYSLFKISGQTTIGLARRRPFDAELVYEVGFQSIALGQRTLEDALAGINSRIFILPSGDMLFGSLRPALTLDLRDEPARPRSGFVAQLSGDWLRSFDASQINAHLFKAQALLAGYVPLPALSSLVLSARGGRIYQLSAGSSTPGDRRFYLGGATTLRGFHENGLQPQDTIDALHSEVRACEGTISGFACSQQALLVQAGATSAGGDLFVAFGAELRVPFAASLEAAAFYDAGNLWSDPTKFRETFALRDAVGFGVRWLTPIGRLAIDIGFNLHPDSLLGEPQFAPYFSVDPL